MHLSKIANLIDAQVPNLKEVEVSGFSSPENPKPNTIIYIAKPENYNIEELAKNSVLLLDFKFIDIYKFNNSLFSKNPKLSFTKLANIFAKANSSLLSIHERPDLYLGENVYIGNNSKFGRNVVIENNVKIGSNCLIHHNVVIHSNVTIGDNVIISSGSIIGSEGFGNIFSDDLRWLHIQHKGGVTIGNDCQIGSNCCIDQGTIDPTVIKNGVILDNLVHIAHNVKIGSNTAIAAKVGIAGSCLIGERNMIGGMVGIVDHIKTADDVIITATSTVNKDLKEPGTYTGIMPISEHVNWKRVALWITKLDKIVKFLNIKKI